MIERFRVAPGSVTALSVTGGDRFEVIDRYGRQPVELTVLAADPRAVSGSAPDSPATVLRALVAGPDENGYAAGRILGLLTRHVDQDQARATRLFGVDSAAGARLGFAVDDDAVALIAVPATPMNLAVAESNPPSEVLVEVHRSSPPPVHERELPAPLAEPLWDMRIDASTASSYEIRGRPVRPDHRRPGPAMFGLPGLRRPRTGHRPRVRAWTPPPPAPSVGAPIRSRACSASSSTAGPSRWSRWCAIPWDGTTPSRWPAPPSTTPISAIPATSTAPTTSTRPWRGSGWPPAPGGRH